MGREHEREGNVSVISESDEVRGREGGRGQGLDEGQRPAKREEEEEVDCEVV